MSFVYDQKVVDSMYGSHVVSMAVDYGVDLVKMWPLQTNQELENDVKYAENLQVMFSGMMTQVLLKRSEEVDQSVAEAVYEGMDVLPGVDPEIIRTLMDANRAYDVMASYHGVDGIELFMETARILGIDVETRIEKEIQDLMENLSRTMRSASGFEVDDDVAENVGICQSATVDRNEFARRYLASMTVLDALINLMCYGTDDSQEQAIRDCNLAGVCAAGGNALEHCSGAVETPAICKTLREHGAVMAQMTGSGAAVFGIFDDENAARSAVAALKNGYKQVYLCKPTHGGPRVTVRRLFGAKK